MSRFTSTLLAASTLAAVVATPALAQTRDPTPFDGPYVGAAFGYSWLNPEVSTSFAGGARDSVDTSAKGVDGTLFVGYGKTFDRLYVGGEAELGFTDLNETYQRGLNSYRAGSDFTWGLSGRAGYLVDTDTLVYGRVGWQRLDLNVDGRLGSVATVGGTVPTIDESTGVDGVRFGGGVERSLGNNLLARIEYNFTQYEDVTFRYPLGAGSSKFEPEQHNVRVGIAYRF